MVGKPPEAEQWEVDVPVDPVQGFVGNKYTISVSFVCVKGEYQ